MANDTAEPCLWKGGEEGDTQSRLPLTHSEWFCSLCHVKGYWETLGNGPNSLILALEEDLKAILCSFKARYGATPLCACSHPHSSNVECGILHSVVLMVQIWYLQLWRRRCSRATEVLLALQVTEPFPSHKAARWRGRRQVWVLPGEAGSEHTAPHLRGLFGHQQKDLSLMGFYFCLGTHLPDRFGVSYFAYSCPCCLSLYFVLLVK